MLIHILITDDAAQDAERLARDIRRHMAQKSDLQADIRLCHGAEEALSCYSNASVQLVFLDIQMPGMNGIDLAIKLRSLDPRLLIVFLTASRDYAFDAFPVHPFDYLVKPWDPVQIDRVLDEALRVLENPEPEIMIRAAYASYAVSLDQIVSVLSYGHNVEIQILGSPAIRSIMTFSQLEKQLSEDPRFLTCSRGVMVNMDHVTALEGDTFRMAQGPACPLRVRERTRLIARFSQYQISRMKSRRQLSAGISKQMR